MWRRSSEALQLCQAAERQEPENARVQHHRDLAYELAGSREQTGHKFRLALEIYPGQEKSREELGWIKRWKAR